LLKKQRKLSQLAVLTGAGFLSRVIHGG